MKRDIILQTAAGKLFGQLSGEDEKRGLILLPKPHRIAAHDSEAEIFRQRGHAVLAIELLSEREMHYADATQDVARLSARLLDVLDLIQRDGDMSGQACAIHASADIVPAALRAAARRDRQVQALCACGGLIDRAGVEALQSLRAPLLMLFSDDDPLPEAAWERALRHLSCPAEARRLQAGENPATPALAWFAPRLKI